MSAHNDLLVEEQNRQIDECNGAIKALTAVKNEIAKQREADKDLLKRTSSVKHAPFTIHAARQAEGILRLETSIKAYSSDLRIINKEIKKWWATNG